jgi:hypothetical protein
MLNSAIKSEAEALHRFFSPDRTKATVVNQVMCDREQKNPREDTEVLFDY